MRALYAVRLAVDGDAGAGDVLYTAVREEARRLLAGAPEPDGPTPSIEALAARVSGDPQVLHWVDADQVATLLLWLARQIGAQTARIVEGRPGIPPLPPSPAGAAQSRPQATFILFLERYFPEQHTRLFIGFTEDGAPQLLFDVPRPTELERLSPAIARIRRRLGLPPYGEDAAQAADRRFRAARAAFLRQLADAARALLRDFGGVPSRTRLAERLGTSRARLATSLTRYGLDYDRDLAPLRRDDPLPFD